MWYNLGSVSFLARLSLYRMANATRGADVAQLVEQPIRNEQVTGSIPAIGSIKIARPLGLVIFMDFDGGINSRLAHYLDIHTYSYHKRGSCLSFV